MLEERRGLDDKPYALRTVLGWSLVDSVVVVVVTLPLPRDGVTVIQVHAINPIEFRLGKRLQPISNQS